MVRWTSFGRIALYLLLLNLLMSCPGPGKPGNGPKVSQNPTATPTNRKALVDYRNLTDKSLSLSKDLEQLIIAHVQKYGTVAPCSDSSNPQVLSTADGSFSAPNQKETVYLVSLGDSCHTSGQNTIVAAVFRGKQLLYTADATGYSSVQKVFDINSDGVNEILVDDLFIHGGYELRYAAIASLNVNSGKRIQIQKEFPEVYLSNFSGGYSLEPKGAFKKAAVLYPVFQPDGSVKFEREEYIASCNVPEVQRDANDVNCEPYLEQRIELTENTRLDLKGIGPIRVGMTVEKASQAAGIPLISLGSRPDVPECVYYKPLGGPEGISFMVIDGQIARVDVENSVIKTGSGAAVGNTEKEVRDLYRDKISISPHEYIVGGHYLTFTPQDKVEQNYSVIFETDSNGRVIQIRSGRLPEVELVEGCS